MIHVTIVAPDDDDPFFYEWLRNKEWKDGTFISSTDGDKPSVKTMNFENARCYRIQEFFRPLNPVDTQMLTEIAIHARNVIFGRKENNKFVPLTIGTSEDTLAYDDSEEYTKEADLANGNTPKTGTSAEPQKQVVYEQIERNVLLKNETQIGTYKELVDTGKIGDNITPHHIPSNEYMKRYMKEKGIDYSTNDGVCINMEHPNRKGRHRQTKTYNNNMTKAEKDAYYKLTPQDALEKDIKDIRQIYKNEDLYNNEIEKSLQEAIKLNESKYPNLYK